MSDQKNEPQNELTPEAFSLMVEQRHYDLQDELYYSEVTTLLIEELDIEPEDAKRLITSTLYAKIEAESIERRMIKGGQPMTRFSDLNIG